MRTTTPAARRAPGRAALPRPISSRSLSCCTGPRCIADACRRTVCQHSFRPRRLDDVHHSPTSTPDQPARGHRHTGDGGDGRRRGTASAAAADVAEFAVPWSDAADGFARGTTGGAGGEVVTVTTQAQLNQYVTAADPYVVKVAGTITMSPRGTELRVASHKTIVGVGTSGHIVGGGFFLAPGVTNVIIRNLTIRDTLMPEDDPGDDSYDYDAIQIDTADRIWIDHNRLTRMNDGLLDSRKDTTRITVSWNHFADNNKTFGIGWTDRVTAQMTVHHNWFQNTRARNPSADNLAAIHLYNNYLQNGGDGNYVRGATKAVVENSYFENTKNPYWVRDTGELVQRGNILVNSTWSATASRSGAAPSTRAASIPTPCIRPPTCRRCCGPTPDRRRPSAAESAVPVRVLPRVSPGGSARGAAAAGRSRRPGAGGSGRSRSARPRSPRHPVRAAPA